MESIKINLLRLQELKYILNKFRSHILNYTMNNFKNSLTKDKLLLL